MAINFDALPQDKPNEVVEGLMQLTVDSAEATLTKDNREAINIKFKTPQGATVYETFVDDSSKPFLMYKLSRLLHAMKITLSGASFKISDLLKFLPKGSTVWAYVVKNDRNYPTVSFKGDHKGFYLPGEFEGATATATAPATAAPAAPEQTVTQSPALNVTDTDDSY